MPRLPLLLCVVALLASTLSALLYFRIGNSKQVLELKLTEAGTRAAKLDSDLAAANQHNGSLRGQLGALTGELNNTRSKLAVADSRVGQLDRELAAARSDLSAAREVVTVYEVTARALADE